MSKPYNPLLGLARNAKLRHMEMQCKPEWVLELAAERDTLAARVAELERDAARLDWLDRQGEAYGVHQHEGNRWVLDGTFRTARDAIDAEMGANQCDGCRAGKPLENGKHRMGAGTYPDWMACQAKRYP
jgi:hypothetical protein